MNEEQNERIQALAKAMRRYRRATRAAQLLSWGHTVALGCAAASLALGGARVFKATRE
ncbi:MAG: hypothetical protein LBS96_03815 [Oscillospiraceae bacterium]|jgi:hypothetical protein|nr:hypothetical protein [Oscillospiraceae bacterium]